MNCHKTVTTAFETMFEERQRALEAGEEPTRIVSEEIAKLYASMGLDENLEPLETGPRPIEWVKVHNAQDFVAFDHSVHVARGMACETCHGPVGTMERLRQEYDLTMGWCVNCHRENVAVPAPGIAQPTTGRLPDGEHVSTDCAACHY
jgi:hypothetical protein